jgi:hypothetical protein
MASADLPREICDIIIDLLDCADAESDVDRMESRIETLKSCTLISKAWTASAQSRIFQTIYIVDALGGNTSAMPQSRRVAVSQVPQHPTFSAPSLGAPDSKFKAKYDPNSELSIPLTKLCEVLWDSRHLRPFVKKLEIRISESALAWSKDPASNLFTEWVSSNELALYFLFQIETLPELRHLSLQLPYRVEDTASGTELSNGSLFFDMLRRYLSFKAQSDAPVTHLSLTDISFEYPSQLGELLEETGSRGLEVLILNNVRVFAVDQSSSEVQDHIGISIPFSADSSASCSAPIHVPSSSSSLRHLSLINIPYADHKEILHWMLCRSSTSKSQSKSQALTLDDLQSFYYKSSSPAVAAEMMVSSLEGEGFGGDNLNARHTMLQEFVRSVSPLLKRLYVGCMKGELDALGLPKMAGKLQLILNVSPDSLWRLHTYYYRSDL